MASTSTSKDCIDKDSLSRFYGVYLLCSESKEKRYNGKCYIGFTVNPNRRIRQHNEGKEFGGAKKTNNKGPWTMVMIIHGFPNNIAALQFEWAWQQPAMSLRLKNYPELKRKLTGESSFQYNFRILCHMLNVGPWYRLPLIINWLDINYKCEFDLSLKPPSHMRIVTNEIALPLLTRKKISSLSSTLSRSLSAECHLCLKSIENVSRSLLRCLNSSCYFISHMICLANYFISADNTQYGHYIPISGRCPLCETLLLWMDLLQQKFYKPNHQNEGQENIANHHVSDDGNDVVVLSD